MSRFLVLIVLSTLSIPSFADVRFSSGWVEMGRVRVNSTGFHSIYLRNAGNEEVRVSVSDNCFNGFWISNSCIGLLRPGALCNISIRFSPRREGRYSCTLSARDDRGGWDRATVSGTGYDDRRRR